MVQAVPIAVIIAAYTSMFLPSTLLAVCVIMTRFQRNTRYVSEGCFAFRLEDKFSKCYSVRYEYEYIF